MAALLNITHDRAQFLSANLGVVIHEAHGTKEVPEGEAVLNRHSPFLCNLLFSPHTNSFPYT